MNWKPGDRALIISEESFLGRQCTVVSVRTNSPVYSLGEIVIWPHLIEVDIEGLSPPLCSGNWAVKPEWLRKIDDGSDYRKVSSWDECPFKPAATHTSN